MTPNELDKLSNNLCFFTELESKNYKLLLAENGNRSMMEKINKEIKSLESQIKLKEATCEKSKSETCSLTIELKTAFLKLNELVQTSETLESEKVSNTLTLKLLKEKTIPELEDKVQVLESSRTKFSEESELLEQKICFLMSKIEEISKQIELLIETLKSKEELAASKNEQLKQLALKKFEL